MEWPLPSNVALKWVPSLGAEAGPRGSQPLPPLWYVSPESLVPLACVEPSPSVSKSRSRVSS